MRPCNAVLLVTISLLSVTLYYLSPSHFQEKNVNYQHYMWRPSRHCNRLQRKLLKDYPEMLQDPILEQEVCFFGY